MSTNYFHIGILVADLDAAIPKFSKLFGVVFNPPSVMRAPIEWHGQKLDMDIRVTYSKEPPYIELIEGQSEGYYAISQGEGIHHIGLWVPEYGTVEWNERFGDMEIESLLFSPTGVGNAKTSPGCLCGVRLELVDEGSRAALERWVNGGASSLAVE
ncbi:VOC family protein [Sphingobium bisphenolivorans]|uniref:VOC family protein n=1 Tax=Sphingobium bisphenolivorans TaxID=1335760 RepID=UPI0003A73C96|nr:VOC family protein [Sphingobium bisphenolivorans]